MKIVIVGGTGTIGQKVSAALAQRHEVLTAGRTTADLHVELSDSASIQAMFEKSGPLDALVCIAGEAKWAPFATMSEADFAVGLQNKLMGQVNLVRIGQNYLRPEGSFTLSTGILADDPVVSTSSPALVNGALHSFVKAVALELTQGQRINAVSCGLVEDAVEKYQDYFYGHNPVPMNKVINGYLKSVEGRLNGQIIRVYD
jgi:NAD(P)-dependent dehydrogenase (short-subunit alcohol dehydrogenase family)